MKAYKVYGVTEIIKYSDFSLLIVKIKFFINEKIFELNLTSNLSIL